MDKTLDIRPRNVVFRNTLTRFRSQLKNKGGPFTVRQVQTASLRMLMTPPESPKLSIG